eukprot:gb/GECG01011700.1/.p1 GENE.gb/GECG01011700.1/~~gb/GECG01011700.1/.p1  ORF type:complete len:346 (+),score=27.19 gb/GECG01011700.1/:1-1038(+)
MEGYRRLLLPTGGLLAAVYSPTWSSTRCSSSMSPERRRELREYITAERGCAHPVRVADFGPIRVIGGHGGMLKLRDHVLKPIEDSRGRNELAFYVELNQHCPPSEYPARLTPQFYGVMRPSDLPAWMEKDYSFIRLEDLTEGYRKPCVIDIKLGTRTWDPLATERKRIRQMLRYPPQLVTGFRIIGMHIFRPFSPDSHEDGKWLEFQRRFGRSLTEDELPSGLLEYVHDGQRVRWEVLENMLDQLYQLRNWFQKQQGYRFISTSLMVIFEGKSGINEDPRVRLSMIDFAHTFPIPPDSSTAYEQRDEDYLLGLSNLIAVIERLIAERNRGYLLNYQPLDRSIDSS